MPWADALSTDFVASFETRCPELRMTKKERSMLHTLFTECQVETWETVTRILEQQKPK